MWTKQKISQKQSVETEIDFSLEQKKFFQHVANLRGVKLEDFYIDDACEIDHRMDEDIYLIRNLSYVNHMLEKPPKPNLKAQKTAQAHLKNIHSEYRIEPLSSKHSRSSFCCGVNHLDYYLKKTAMRDVKNCVNTVFVAVHRSSNIMAGYYTLASSGLICQPPFFSCFAIGYLAVDQQHQNKHLGRCLLFDALHRSMKSQIGAVAIALYAQKSSYKFYKQYGFLEVPQRMKNLKRMFLPMKTVHKLFTEIENKKIRWIPF